ncbi:hypothetical protein NHQ30_002762 [Ciborinia camelliae]|nr:hypothetical protein NHQ30_002762 [Ciborinia camelliae]
MKIPPDLLGFDGKVANGEICLKGGNNTKLHEEGIKREGNRFTCYALTAENDTITPFVFINSGVDGFVDVIVDGILRASYSKDKPTAQFQKKFDSFVGQVKQGTDKYASKVYQLQVTKRNTGKTRNVKSSHPSAVSSIEIQIFRQDPNAHKAHTKDSDSGSDSDSSSLSSEGTPDLAQRAPTFEDHAEWWHLNSRVDEDANPPPPFEVVGVNHKNLNLAAKKRILKKWPGDFKLWSSFKFLLFSTADFYILGFPNTPDYNGTPWSEVKSTSKKPAVKDVSHAAKSSPTIDADADDDAADEPVQTIKDKEVRKKTGTSNASGETEVSSLLANLRELAGNSSPADSSDIREESPDAEIIAAVSNPIHNIDDSQLTVSRNEEASEPADTVLYAPSIPAERVELASNDIDQDNKVPTNRKKQKPISMPGIEGAPANNAWKDPNRSEWNQRTMLGSDSDNLSTLTTNQFHTDQDSTLPDKAPGDLRESSAPCVIGQTLEKDDAAPFKSSSSVEPSSSSWEPITPPASSNKQGTKHFENFGDQRRVLSGEFNGVKQVESAARAIVIEDDYSDNTTSSREASPSVDYRQRLEEKKAEKVMQRDLGLTFQSPDPNQEEAVPPPNVDLRERYFDEFIYSSPQPEDTEMVDAFEAELEPKVRSSSSKANLLSPIRKQGQYSVNKVSSSQSQDLTTFQHGQTGSQTPTEDDSQSFFEEASNIQENNKAQLDTEMTGSDSNTMPTETMVSDGEPNDALADIGNQQDGRQDSPAQAVNSPVKASKPQNTRAPATAKSSSVPKSQSTTISKTQTSQKTPAVQKKPATKVESSSNVSAQPEQFQAKTKKPATKAESSSMVPDQSEKSQAKPKKPAPKAPSAPKTAKAVTPAIAEDPTSKPKGKGKAKAASGDKRKADQMTSAGSSSGSNKTNASPAAKHTSIAEREIAAAEARMQAAVEKKKALEEKLQAVRDMNVQMEKVNEINRQAQALEEGNAELEAEIAKITAPYDIE